ncbi:MULTISPECIES: phage tail protein [Rhodococcus]|uniref:Phage tail protein n=1 Tax=Rhodococcus opacus RKJ300 = JCM 13270 TaxID=1165867 RepID=I0WDL3_RHOOP|nr:MULTISPECIES: phage tail protein [Rhodococcus]EID74479.1 phage tail protein [Rhodococcus opacus RKJ300 = JCM 13270]QQZ18448.1 hypothetical protein GO592_40420 [Rhodococcus sp. 21391]
MTGHWFLLADRPGWRLSAVLGSGTTTDGGSLRLAETAPPTVLDCPPEAYVDLPCCERAVLRPPDRTVALVAGTGQVRALAGPWRVQSVDVDGITMTDVSAGWRVPDDGCALVREWPEGTWAPDGLVCLEDGGVGVLDRVAGLVHVLDERGRWREARQAAEVPGCRPGPQPRYPTSGSATTIALDSGAPGCRWHRVVLNGQVPQGARVEVEALVTDADLGEGEVAVLDADRWADVGVFGDPALTSWDALVQAPRGRYLWLRLTLRGDGTATPVVDDVEVHFPRETSLRQLPAVYAAGESDALERFLALTDTVRASVTQLLDDVPRDLDPRSADTSPGRDLLAWLGTWVGMTGMGALPEERRRRLVGAAGELYRRRGTPDGVARHVGLWLGRRTQVLEHYRLRRWAVLDHGHLGDATKLFGREIVGRLQLDGSSAIGAFRLVSTPSPRQDPFAVYAHRFTVFVHAEPCDRPEDLDDLAATAAAVLQAVQPAHTVSSVALVTPTARVTTQASLGIDAVVAGPLPSLRLGDRLGTGPGQRLGLATTLARDPGRGDRPAIGIDARVGTRAVIG